jgi:hypothetical protein
VTRLFVALSNSFGSVAVVVIRGFHGSRSYAYEKIESRAKDSGGVIVVTDKIFKLYNE